MHIKERKKYMGCKERSSESAKREEEYRGVVSIPYLKEYLKNLSEWKGNIVFVRLSNLAQKSNK